MRKKGIGGIRKALDSSSFVFVLNKLSEFIHSKICFSKTAQALTSYDSVDQALNDSLLSRLLERIRPRKKTVLKVKNKITEKVEDSLAHKIMERIIDVLLGCKARVYGIIFFIMGFTATGIGIIERFLLTGSEDIALMVQGIAFIVLSIPLIASKDELCTLLVTSRIARAITSFIGYESEDIVRKPIAENLAVPVLIGVFLGVLTILIQPIYFVILALAVIYLGIVFHKPEFSVIITVATLPFLPTMVICGEIIITLISYVIKLIRGKRSLKLDVLDIFVLIFAIFMFLGGLFSVTPSQSLPPACVFVCFIAAYFLVVNLIKKPSLVKKLLLSSMVSFFICSLYGIYQNFFATPDTTWTDEEMFTEIETRVVSTFENPNVFGEYLIMLIPVAIVFIVIAKSFSDKIVNLIVTGSAVMALVYTWSRGAWIGCIASLAILFVIINKKALGTYFLGVVAFPLAIPFLPESIISRFTSIGNMTDGSTSYRVFIWEASAGMIKDYLFSGIGIGTGAFQTVYSEYALAGIETAPHSHNLYLQILVELGIFGFAVFALVLFFYFSKLFTFLKNSSNREMKLIVGAIGCGILAILAQGLTDYVWYNYRVFAFFWMMLAASVAAINTAKESEEKNDNI